MRAHHVCQYLCAFESCRRTVQCTVYRFSFNHLIQYKSFRLFSSHFYRCQTEDYFPADFCYFSWFICERSCVLHVVVIYSMCRYSLFIMSAVKQKSNWTGNFSHIYYMSILCAASAATATAHIQMQQLFTAHKQTHTNTQSYCVITRDPRPETSNIIQFQKWRRLAHTSSSANIHFSETHTKKRNKEIEKKKWIDFNCSLVLRSI